MNSAAPQATLPIPPSLVRLGRWLAAASPWRVLGVLAAVRVALVGVHTAPNIERWLAFTGDPFGTPSLPTSASYISGSPLGPVLGHALGVETELGIGLVHLVVLATGAALIIAMARRWAGDRTATALAVILFASPLSSVLLTWLGQPDPFVFAAGGVAALASAAPTSRPALAAAATAGVVLGLSSLEQGVAGAVALTFLVVANGTAADRRCLLALFAGLAVGGAGLAGFHAVSHMHYTSRWEYFSNVGLTTFLRGWLASLPTLLFSAFGAAWLLMVRWSQVEARRWLRGAVLALVIGLGASAIALDQTRVLTLVLWPATVRLTRLGVAADGALDVPLALTVVGGAVLPQLVVWDGAVLVHGLGSWVI